MSDATRAILLVGVHDGFRVAAGPVAMACLLQIRPQRGVIEHLAVVGNPDPAGFIRHGLMPASHIDNAQSAVPQKGNTVLVNVMAIRSPVADCFRHAPEIGA